MEATAVVADPPTLGAEAKDKVLPPWSVKLNGNFVAALSGEVVAAPNLDEAKNRKEPLPVSMEAVMAQVTPLTAMMLTVRPPEFAGLNGAWNRYWPETGTGPPT